MLLRRILFVVLLTFVTATAAAQQAPRAEEIVPRNVILFIADGTGPASFTMARDYLRDYAHQDSTLALDSIQVGSIRTFAANSRVTDSAAGATAFSAGVKTYNGAIAVDTVQWPVATLLEAAERAGMATGLVATSRITHATPAAFAAHVPNRGMENEIAAQELQQGIEVLFGGGRRHFLPEADEGYRDDGRNLLEEARADSYQVVFSRAELDDSLQTPVLGLFSMDHMDYEIDRDPQVQPSLAEMTTRAIELLQRASGDQGFFLMVEGSRIDHAGHSNDAAAHLHDVLAYNEAVAAALAFASQNGETLIVSTSDHETGGLSLGREVDGHGIYGWNPDTLAQVKTSHGPMMEAIIAGDRTPAEVLREYASIDSLMEAEQALLAEDVASGARQLNFILSDIIGRRAIVGWTTGGHTAVDVNLYAYGPGHERFVGNHDNTYIGRALADLMGVDLKTLTVALREQHAPRTPATSGSN